jgi:hypothetical protein
MVGRRSWLRRLGHLDATTTPSPSAVSTLHSNRQWSWAPTTTSRCREPRAHTTCSTECCTVTSYACWALFSESLAWPHHCLWAAQGAWWHALSSSVAQCAVAISVASPTREASCSLAPCDLHMVPPLLPSAINHCDGEDRQGCVTWPFRRKRWGLVTRGRSTGHHHQLLISKPPRGVLVQSC